MTVQVTLDSRKSSSSHPGKGQIGTGGAAHPPLANILLLALKCHHLPPQCCPGGDTGTPTVCSPGAARGRGLARSSPSHRMPELSRNRSHWERLKCGNGRRALDSSPHRFSKLVQPDVSSCWSMEQQRRLSPCRGGVSRTPGLGQAPFPGSYGWDVFHSIPHSTGAAGSGTDVSLPHLQASLQPLSRCCCSRRLCPSCCYRGKGVLALAFCPPF